MSVLNEIVANKKKEVEAMKKNAPLSRFADQLKKANGSFRKAISKNKLCLIAEIKRSSPSQKVISASSDIAKIAGIYSCHADAISVLTDEKYFNGSLDDLDKVRSLTQLPILRKEFIVDEYQIYQSRLHGADAILLIVAALSQEQLKRFLAIAASLGMDCLVEAHDKEELKTALDCGAQIVGINNRNLHTLKTDLDTTFELISGIPKGKIIVSESGIQGNSDVAKLRGKVNAILVGTLLMRSSDMEKEIVSLMK